MGLGKTLQAITVLSHLTNTEGLRGPYLIVVPLTTLSNWEGELARFCPSLKVAVYSGMKEEREAKRLSIINHIKALPKAERKDPTLPFHVFLTTYDHCLRDFEDFIELFKWRAVFVDEAQRLKSAKSSLYKTLKTIKCGRRLLLTGTPVQNNLKELFALLSFVAPHVFGRDGDEFACQFAKVGSDPKLTVALHRIIRPFLLRRTKAEVATFLPEKTESVLYTDLSPMQKLYYRAVLGRDLSVFKNPKGVSLQNTLMQLRKCCNHPYLFEGAEAEPYEEGDHVIHNSGKMVILDQLLPQLKADGHKVLLFCQSTQMLDILQDYLTYRGYNYERLDGSVRGEERYNAIANFSSGSEDVFVFLLSTRAGGVGVNLVAADVVIFLESDWNPQVDLQAQARAHRIGQTKPVRVIRLICRNTVEDLIYKRAQAKLKLQYTVIEQGKFNVVPGAGTIDDGADEEGRMSAEEFLAVVKFGLATLLKPTSASTDDGHLTRTQIVERDTPGFVKSLHLSPADLAVLLSGGSAGLGAQSGGSSAVQQGVSEALSDGSPNKHANKKAGKGKKGTTAAMPATEQLSQGPLITSSLLLHVDDDNTAGSLAVEDRDSSPPAEGGGVTAENMYLFEGIDYGAERKKEDDAVFASLLASAAASQFTKSESPDALAGTTRTGTKRKAFEPLHIDTDEEVEAKRIKLAAQTAARKLAARQKKLAQWAEEGYTSYALALEDDDSGDGPKSATDGDDEEDSESGDKDDGHGGSSGGGGKGRRGIASESDGRDPTLPLGTSAIGALGYVSGDVTVPSDLPLSRSAIVVCCVDNGGKWGKGRFFASVAGLSPVVAQGYSLAKQHGDLTLGSVHLFPVGVRKDPRPPGEQDPEREEGLDDDEEEEVEAAFGERRDEIKGEEDEGKNKGKGKAAMRTKRKKGQGKKAMAAGQPGRAKHGDGDVDGDDSQGGGGGGGDDDEHDAGGDAVMEGTHDLQHPRGKDGRQAKGKAAAQAGSLYVALVVAQSRTPSGSVSGIQAAALSKALKKLHGAARNLQASVHFPRIGWGTKNFNWYGTERLIKKTLAARGIPTYVYYFKRVLPPPPVHTLPKAWLPSSPVGALGDGDGDDDDDDDDDDEGDAEHRAASSVHDRASSSPPLPPSVGVADGDVDDDDNDSSTESFHE